jgi:hypothetical protein
MQRLLSPTPVQFMFAVQKRMKFLTRGVTRLEDFTHFSDGLVDLVICMVANRRERKYISLHPEYCPESDPNIFGGPLSRAVLMTLQILNAKLILEHKRVDVSIESHRHVALLSSIFLSVSRRSLGPGDLV